MPSKHRDRAVKGIMHFQEISSDSLYAGFTSTQIAAANPELLP